jgi:hypothetical protein
MADIQVLTQHPRTRSPPNFRRPAPHPLAQVGDVNVVNVSAIIQRFGSKVVAQYAEQFESSPVLFVVLVAILSAVLFGLLVVHVALAYSEQTTLQEEDAELKKKN